MEEDNDDDNVHNDDNDDDDNEANYYNVVLVLYFFQVLKHLALHRTFWIGLLLLCNGCKIHTYFIDGHGLAFGSTCIW
jgi:hypothetical protein